MVAPRVSELLNQLHDTADELENVDRAWDASLDGHDCDRSGQANYIGEDFFLQGSAVG